MQRNNTIRHSHGSQTRQQGSVWILLAVAIAMIAGIYVLFGMWGWPIIVGLFVIVGVVGMFLLEAMARNKGVNSESKPAIGHESASATKQHVQVIPESSNPVAAEKKEPVISLSVDAAETNVGISEDNGSTVAATTEDPVSVENYQLDMVNPGKEPVKVMRLLHHELGLSAEQAKQVIIDRKFPVTLAKGSKAELQEKAKKFLKAGAKLRLATLQATQPESEANTATVVDQKAG